MKDLGPDVQLKNLLRELISLAFDCGASKDALSEEYSVALHRSDEIQAEVIAMLKVKS